MAAGQATYEFNFLKAGSSDSPLLMFALPHHIQSFASTTKSQLTRLQLATATKGMATGLLADKWTMVENLPISMGFNPWTQSGGSTDSYSAAVVSTLRRAAIEELSQDMDAQTDLDSTYYAGKVSNHIPPLAMRIRASG